MQRNLYNKLFIDGRFVDAASGATIDVFSPADGRKITEIAAAYAADVDLAVKAAQRALPIWSAMAAAERGRCLLKLADLIEANAAELAHLETLDTGHPIRDTRNLDVPRTAACMRPKAGVWILLLECRHLLCRVQKRPGHAALYRV